MSFELPNPSEYVVLQTDPPPGEGIIMTNGDKQTSFQFGFVPRDELPKEATEDNWIEIDDYTYQVWRMPGCEWFGASMALQVWGEGLFDDDEDAQELTQNCPRCGSDGPFKSTGFDGEYQCEKCGSVLAYLIMDDEDD